jgi:imidazolonepropionase-like amidohydrolase
MSGSGKGVQSNMQSAYVGTQRHGDGVIKLLRNATLWTGELGQEEPLRGYDVLIGSSGKIVEVGQRLSHSDAVVLEMNGAHLSASIIDVHSHAGVYAYPEDAFGTANGNEMSHAAVPFVRSVDAIDLHDPAIDLIRRGGVTTSLILPGSGTAMGGQAQAVKFRKSNRIEDVIVVGAPRYMKHACGENPRKTGARLGILPRSSMGVNWVFRERYYAAARLLAEQQEWQCLDALADGPMPNDLELEPMVAALRGELLVNVHCYKVEDMEAFLRVALEFNFTVGAFHHATEAWKMIDDLRRYDVPVAIFSDHMYYKMEADEGTVSAPALLSNAGVPVALKSDHPVEPAWHLSYSGGLAHHWGMSKLNALRALTAVPARIMGIDAEHGTVAAGKWADLVVWDRAPHMIGVQPRRVYIEGEEVARDASPAPLSSGPAGPGAQATLSGDGDAAACSASNLHKPTASACYVVDGARVFALVDGGSAASEGTVRSVVVRDGVVACVGAECLVPAGCERVVASAGAWLVPGAVHVGSTLGASEVGSEAASQAGFTNAGYDQRQLRSIDGIRFSVFNQRHMHAAFASGVLAAVSTSQASVLLPGTAGAYRTSGVVATDAIVADEAALLLTFGQRAKQSGSSGIATQMSLLRAAFDGARTALAKARESGANVTDPVQRALDGQLPVLAHAHNADDIARLVRLSVDYAFRLIVLGGGEAHVVADSLAANNVAVILSPARLPPANFETWRARDDSAVLLAAAGVELAIGVENSDIVRNTRFEAGIQAARGLDELVALRSITSTPASLFGLDTQGVGQVRVGTPASFVVYSDSPLTFNGYPLLIADRNQLTCHPLQPLETQA